MFFVRLMALAALGACLLPAQLMRVMVVDVKSDRVLEFQDLQKKATAAYQKAGTAFRAVYAPAGLGEQNIWYGFTPMTGYAEFDAPIVEKVMGAEYKDFTAQARNLVNSVRYEVVERRPNLTIDEGDRPGGLYSVAELQIHPGQESAFEAKYQAAIPALKKLGVKTFLVSRVRYGNQIGLYRFGIALERFGDLDKGQLLVRALGEEGYAKWRSAIAEHIQSVRYSVVRLHPELSYRK